jgi:hypothetical protein
MDRLNKQRDAAQEALSLAEGLLSTIQSALDGIRGQQEFDELTHARAAKQLAAWAKANTLPDVDKLSRVLDILAKADKQEFATAQEYRLAQAATYANLLALEAKAEKQVNWAEKQVQAIESQIERLNDFNDRTQANLAAQREQAAAWRDAQLAGMAAQLQALIDLPANLASLAAVVPEPATAPQFTLPSALVEGYRQSSEAQTAEIKGLREELAMLRKDMAATATAQVAPLKSLDDRTRKWDLDGMPAGRDDVTVLRAA